VKLLDFGLAKQMEPGFSGRTTMGAPPMEPGTEMGVVLGTVGYMSPEQVRGEPADHRADIFAFGVVLYEMLAGKRPFEGGSAVQTLLAILDGDPPDLMELQGAVTPILARTVTHCLEKRASDRFQSMGDVAFALQNVTSLRLPPRAPEPPGRRFPRVTAGLLAWVLGAVGVAGTALGLAGLIQVGGPAKPPVFMRLAHPRGTIAQAFFGPDGMTIYFSERIQGGKAEVFAFHPGARTPSPLGFQDAQLAGVSGTSELALLRSPVPFQDEAVMGTLAQADCGGGVLKDIQENVTEAAWEGNGWATVSTDATRSRIHLAFAGRGLVEATRSERELKELRVTRDGGTLALVDADFAANRASIVTYDRQGNRRTIYSLAGNLNGRALTGLAWGPHDALWWSELQGEQTALMSWSGRGRPRIRWRGPGFHQLMDISRDGRVLMARQQGRMGVLGTGGDETTLRDLSVQDGTQASGLSEDGRALLLLESPLLNGGTSRDMAYLRQSGDKSAIPLARGIPATLSMDGQWMQVDIGSIPPGELDSAILAAFSQAGLDPAGTQVPFVLMLHTGIGHPWLVPLPPGVVDPDMVHLLPDGQHFLFSALDQGRDSRWFVSDFSGKEVRAASPGGYGRYTVDLQPLSRDGQHLVVTDGRAYFLQGLAGGNLRPVRGLEPGESILRWAQDDRTLYAKSRGDALPLVISSVDPATGIRRERHRFSLPDAAGFQSFEGVYTTGDARITVFTYRSRLSDLFLVEGLD
jgi:hypothetical protein